MLGLKTFTVFVILQSLDLFFRHWWFGPMRPAFRRHPGSILEENDESDDLEANLQNFGDYQPQQQPQLILKTDEQQQVLR